GQVSVLGHDPEHARPTWRARIGVVLQESEPERDLTVAESCGCMPATSPVRAIPPRLWSWWAGPTEPAPGRPGERSRTARRPGGRDRRRNPRRRQSAGLTGWTRPRRGRDPFTRGALCNLRGLPHRRLSTNPAPAVVAR